jgi:large subunit ribosomal protein L20
MIRIKTGTHRRERHKKLIQKAKSYRGRSNNSYSLAIERVEKGLQYSYAHRKLKKRDFRSLWIQRINAACITEDSTYSTIICKIHNKDILLNRKIISELALIEPITFKALIRNVL